MRSWKTPLTPVWCHSLLWTLDLTSLLSCCFAFCIYALPFTLLWASLIIKMYFWLDWHPLPFFCATDCHWQLIQLLPEKGAGHAAADHLLWTTPAPPSLHSGSPPWAVQNLRALLSGPGGWQERDIKTYTYNTIYVSYDLFFWLMGLHEVYSPYFIIVYCLIFHCALCTFISFHLHTVCFFLYCFVVFHPFWKFWICGLV